jgi:WbqC-like protein family
MILSGHAPSYLPWLGHFEKIDRSDVFVLHDTAQYEKKGFMNRNRIKTPEGSMWLTVPVELDGYLDKELRRIEVQERLGWRQRHWKSIEYNYRRAPFFDLYAERLGALYAHPWRTLVELNVALLRFVMAELGIATPLVLTSELSGIDGAKSDFVLSVCRRMGADAYYCGFQGRDYLREEDFRADGIEVLYQDYRHPTYPQRFGDFLPYLSILDLLFNCGPESREICLGGGSR